MEEVGQVVEGEDEEAVPPEDPEDPEAVEDPEDPDEEEFVVDAEPVEVSAPEEDPVEPPEPPWFRESVR